MEGTQKKEGENPAERKGERVAWMDGGEVWIQGPPPLRYKDFSSLSHVLLLPFGFGRNLPDASCV